jgi:hypothetical protein
MKNHTQYIAHSLKMHALLKNFGAFLEKLSAFSGTCVLENSGAFVKSLALSKYLGALPKT